MLHIVLAVLLLASTALAGTLTRPSGPIVSPDPPDGCRPGSVYIIDAQQLCCQADGETLTPCGTSPPPSTTGVRTTATEVESIRYAVTSLSGVAQLSIHAIVLATVGTGGSTLTVPNPADTSVPGWIKIIVADSGAGVLTLVPYGSTLINGANQSPAPITGIRSSYELFRLSDTEWRVESFSRQGYGEPVFLGQTNTYTFGTQDFTNADAVIMKSAAAYAPTAAGSFGFNSTTATPAYGDGSVSWPIVRGVVGTFDTGSNITCTNPGPSTFYARPFGNSVGGTENQHQALLPSTTRFRNLRVSIPTAVPSGETVVVTLRDDAAGTALTCTATATQTSCTDTTNTVTVAAGSLYDFQVTCAGGTTAVQRLIIHAEMY